MGLKKTYGAHFIKGAFFHRLKEVDGDLVAIPIVSHNYKVLHSLDGQFKDLEDLITRCIDFDEIMRNIPFDYLIIGHGETVSYYLNTKTGLEECNLEQYYVD